MTEYKDYTISAEQYLYYKCYHYIIKAKSGRVIYDSLWIDAADWDTPEQAIEAAKRDIDNGDRYFWVKTINHGRIT